MTLVPSHCTARARSSPRKSRTLLESARPGGGDSCDVAGVAADVLRLLERHPAFVRVKVVSRIPEELEFAPGLLEFLESSSLLPGHAGTVTAASPDGTTTVEIDGRAVGIGSFASTRILVTAS